MENKHAYLIMAHNQFELLNHLILQLDDKRNDIYIHMDIKAKEFDFKKIENLPLESKIYFIPRMDVKWGGYSQIQCELALLKEASKRPYRYYHLLSGADFPLKTQDEIHNFFKRYDGKEFIHFSKVEQKEAKRVFTRISRYHLFQDYSPKKFFKFPKIFMTVIDKSFLMIQRVFGVNRLKGKLLNIKFGSSWFSITDDFTRYVLSHQEWIETHFSHSKCADELFLQTLVYQSPFKEELSSYCFNDTPLSNMRKIDWSQTKRNPNPEIWTVTDYNRLINTEHLFARKFDLAIDSEVIKKLCVYLDNKN